MGLKTPTLLSFLPLHVHSFYIHLPVIHFVAYTEHDTLLYIHITLHIDIPTLHPPPTIGRRYHFILLSSDTKDAMRCRRPLASQIKTNKTKTKSRTPLNLLMSPQDVSVHRRSSSPNILNHRHPFSHRDLVILSRSLAQLINGFH